MKNKINPEVLYCELLNSYGPQGWWPVLIDNHKFKKDERGYHKGNTVVETSLKDKYEIITGAVLTQNTSWKNVEKCILNLKRNGIISADILLEQDENKIKKLIKSSGYYNQKYKKLRNILEYLYEKGYLKITEEKNQGIPARRELLDLWGIGEETADSILLYAYNYTSFVIDAYTKRLTERIMPGKHNLKSYIDYKQYYEDNIKRSVIVYNEFHALIVKHSVEVCRKKPDCEKCFLKNKCLF